jgi:hypothetical protein
MNFQHRANRDAKARELRNAGRRVTVGSSRNVVLSPSYVADYDGTPTPNMFGGTEAEYFPVIYRLEVR